MAIRLDHLSRLTDETGLFQHARGAEPDPAFGYCLDDNARALVAAMRAHALEGTGELLQYIERYLVFVERSQRSDGRFRNFMAADGRWLEDIGSGDAHGRAVWALGFAAEHASSGDMRARALRCLHAILPHIASYDSVRSSAFMLLGLDCWRPAEPGAALNDVRQQLTARLAAAYVAGSAPGWLWFEDELTYSNAHVCQALLSGPERSIGLASLAWLCEVLESDGVMSLIGSDGFYPQGGRRAVYDQQAIDAEATLSACLAAMEISDDSRFRRWAIMAFGWFTGQNVGHRSMIEAVSGGCYDGLTPAGVNTNQGAESLLAWLLAQEDMAEAGLLG